RFLRRLWNITQEHNSAGNPDKLDVAKLGDTHKELRRKTHETIRKVSDDYGRRQTFNTAIAAVMELINEVSRHADRSSGQGLAVEREALNTAVLVLAPCVPHICHVLWKALGNGGAVIDARWPELDESALVQDSVEYVVQVNGKLRGKVKVAADAPKDEVEDAALAEENVKRFTEGQTIRKVIVVPNKLVNVVVG
ncbi:MAG: class I tRNA ligase family protein, partial [Pseudomonadales bacterium]